MQSPTLISRRELFAAGAFLACRIYGQDRPDAELLELSAGPLTLSFQPDIAFVRYVRMGDREVLRGIYAAVRDQTWGTVAPRVSNLKVNRGEGSFGITFDVSCVHGDIDFTWAGALEGKADGTLRFSMNGTANSTFLRNRIGFCVLHPLRECIGQPCAVEQSDGSKIDGKFPQLISPHQPFKNMKAIRHEVTPGVTAEVRFEGDVFEMEDHRNWTDSNFKTYCTPLEKPYPVRVEKGTRIAQSITLRLDGKPTKPLGRVASKGDSVRLSIAEGARKLPRIGFGLPSGNEALRPDEIAKLKVLRPAHLRVDLLLGESRWRDRLAHAMQISNALASPLECAIFVTDDADVQLSAVAAETQKSKARIARWLLFHTKEKSTSGKWVALARKRLPSGAPLAAGTNEFFTELNRERPDASQLDALCYSLNPQVHAFDNASLVENLEAQASTIETARSFAKGRPIAVGPVTFKTRPATDPRQSSAFGAAWTLGSLKYLSEAGADSVTYYELKGPGGLMSAEAVYPLYHVFASVAGSRAQQIIPVRSSNTLAVEALLLGSGSRRRLMIANLTGREERVSIPSQTPAVKGKRDFALEPHSIVTADS